MKFRDKDGNVFENIRKIRLMYCYSKKCDFNGDCAIDKMARKTGENCIDWCLAHPAEAARLMGYEVVEDDSNEVNQEIQQEEANMDKQKPRICALLGVDVGERFRISRMKEKVDFWINEDGTFSTRPSKVPNSSYAILQAIERPEYVIRDDPASESEYFVKDKRPTDQAKPLANWTLGELKAYCHSNVGEEICESGKCPFKRTCDIIERHDEESGYVPGDWGLTDPPHFTDEDVAMANAVERLFQTGLTGELEREEGNGLWIRHDGKRSPLPSVLFSFIRPGTSIKLIDIVGGDN